MSKRTSVKQTVQMGGETFSEANNEDTDGVNVQSVAVPAADAGTLSTRTNATSGVITADESAHGITGSDVIDIYWVGGSRRTCDVDSVSGADITFSGGLGDDLPSQSAVVAAAVPVEAEMVVTGANAKAIAAYTESRGQFVFEDESGEELFIRLGDGVVYNWHDGNGTTNPITGDAIENVKMSHDDTTQAQNMKVGIAYDN